MHHRCPKICRPRDSRSRGRRAAPRCEVISMCKETNHSYVFFIVPIVHVLYRLFTCATVLKFLLDFLCWLFMQQWRLLNTFFLDGDDELGGKNGFGRTSEGCTRHRVDRGVQPTSSTLKNVPGSAVGVFFNFNVGLPSFLI